MALKNTMWILVRQKYSIDNTLSMVPDTHAHAALASPYFLPDQEPPPSPHDPSHLSMPGVKKDSEPSSSLCSGSPCADKKSVTLSLCIGLREVRSSRPSSIA